MELTHIEIKLARATTLPILPNVVAQILQIKDNQNMTAIDYERIISKDAALTAKILRTANSPYYCASREITSVQRAVLQLGQATIRSICLTVAFQSALETKKLDKRFDIRGFWRHSLAVACASKVVAHLMRHPQEEEAFVAGLVHDLGKLALWMFLSSDAHRIYDIVEREKRPHYDVEQAVLGVTHQEIGRLAAERWNLPAAYFLPIAYHHTPMESSVDIDPLTAFVHVGNVLADEMGHAFSPPGEINQLHWEIAMLLDISEEQFIPLRAAVGNAITIISQQLGL